MRILHLVSYPLFSGPLPGTLALALAQRRLGHTVWLACDSRRGNFDGFEEAAEPHLRRTHLSPPLPRPLTLSTHASLSQHWADYRALRGLLRPSQLDVVHVHLSHDHALGALCKSAKVPLVRTVHAARTLQKRIGQRWLMRQADHFIVRSKVHKSRLIDFVRATPDRITTIPGSIQADLWQQPHAEAMRLARQQFRQAHAIPDAATLLGHVALIAGRGQEELLAALATAGAHVEDLHVVFIGDGEAAQSLREEVVRRGLERRVHFTGYLKAPALKNAYAAMDAAFVMQAGNDAAVRAALEAMAAGLPVLASQTDALGELVDAQTGYVLRARDKEAVADCIKAWLADTDLGHARGAAGRARVLRERHIAKEAEATIMTYTRCLAHAKN